MSTPVASLVVMALLACSSFACSKDGAEGKKPTAAATTETSDGGAPTPPAADDWEEVDVSKAEVKVRIPRGATVPADRAGHDAKFAGSFFRVVMPSGYDVLFAERHGNEGGDVAAEKRAFHAKTKGTGAVLYDAPDAFVIRREAGPGAGADGSAGRPYCETTACGNVGDRRICATATGARIDGTLFERLTDSECLAVVTVARSIKAR